MSVDASALHRFEADGVPHVFVVDGSRVYQIDDDPAAPAEANALGRLLAIGEATFVGDEVPVRPPLRALSLAVAQKCNLGCTYCYAQQGEFGGAPRAMPLDVALASVERLFAGALPGEVVSLAFLGGEPLIARDVVRAAVEHAVVLAGARRVSPRFSITTNGTMLSAEDAEFFEAHRFAVTVSLDGVGDVHDALRPYRSGRGSFETILRNVTPLLRLQRRMQVSARVTVTPRNLGLPATLQALLDLGFHSVGFSPVLRAPSGIDEMSHDDLELMLPQMIECGEACVQHLIAGERYPFLNAINALREIHSGTHRPYPCGAGAGYMGVAADGTLSACHRFVGDDAAALGTIAGGVDEPRQARWLAERHVHRQEPCRGCWARYLCGGGCHYEVIHKGRVACDFIRGWLDFCLRAYVRVLRARPEFFGEPAVEPRRELEPA